jgi:hypothetical protein
MQKPLAPVAIPNPTLGASVLLLTHQSTTVNNIGTHMNKRQNWANLFLKIDDPSWDCSSIAIFSPPNLLVLRCLGRHRQSSALRGCRSKHHSNVRPAIPKLVTWFRHMTLLLPTPHIRPLLFIWEEKKSNSTEAKGDIWYPQKKRWHLLQNSRSVADSLREVHKETSKLLWDRQSDYSKIAKISTNWSNTNDSTPWNKKRSPRKIKYL